ncbi:hypothetical protein HDK77DRAFT_123714 [Phyllosticta capitalensis]
MAFANLISISPHHLFCFSLPGCLYCRGFLLLATVMPPSLMPIESLNAAPSCPSMHASHPTITTMRRPTYTLRPSSVLRPSSRIPDPDPDRRRRIPVRTSVQQGLFSMHHRTRARPASLYVKPRLVEGSGSKADFCDRYSWLRAYSMCVHVWAVVVGAVLLTSQGQAGKRTSW